MEGVIKIKINNKTMSLEICEVTPEYIMVWGIDNEITAIPHDSFNRIIANNYTMTKTSTIFMDQGSYEITKLEVL